MAKIRKIYDQTIKPDGSKVTIYPITSTRAVYTPESITMETLINEGYRFGGVIEHLTDSPEFTNQRVFYLADKVGVYPNFGNLTLAGGELGVFCYNKSQWIKGILKGGGTNLTGYQVVTSASLLPDEESTIGYIIGTDLYVWVGEGGDTKEGKYKNTGPFVGPQGNGIDQVFLSPTNYKLTIDFTDGTSWTSEQSIRGIAGAKGDKGNPGLTGAAGATGPKGDKGNPGDSGVSLGEVALTVNLDETETGKALDASAMQTIPHWVDEEQEIEDVPSNYYTRTQTDQKLLNHKAEVNQYLTNQDNDIARLEDRIDNMVDGVDEFIHHRPTVINNGTIINAPDDEDLVATEENTLKFADRPAINAVGYVILRKNKTFAEQVTETNTIYEIRYDFDLGGESVTIPAGCILKFEGGKVTNGTLVGQNTGIEAGTAQIFDTDITLSGSWNVAEAYPEWFGAVCNGSTNCTAAIQKCFSINTPGNLAVRFSSGQYLISPDTLTITRSNLSLIGYNSVIKTNEASSYDYFITAASGLQNVLISGIVFDQRDDTYMATGTSIGGCRIIKIASVDFLKIDNCTFYSYGAQAIIIASIYRKGIVISNNKFYFTRHGDYNYDSSLLYVESLQHTITGNYFDGLYGFTGYECRGGLETHGNKYIVSDNTILNCFAGINATGHSTDVTNDDGALIDRNIINCANAVVLYPYAGGIRNLTIADNTMTLIGLINPTYGAITINTESSTEVIDGVFIHGNFITTKIKGRNTNAALSLDDTGVVKNIEFVNNVVKAFQTYGIYVSDNVAEINSLVIKGNSFEDCCDYHAGLDSIVYIHQDIGTVVFSENVISMSANNRVLRYILTIDSTVNDSLIIEDNSTYSSNPETTFLFERYSVPTTKLRTNQIGLRSLMSSRKPVICDNVATTLLKGDFLIDNLEGLKIAVAPVNTKSFSSGGSFNTRGEYTIYSSGIQYISLGDAVSIDSNSYIINGIRDNRLYFVGLNSSTSGSFGITPAGSTESLKTITLS